ncbi:tyrosine-type recombinase/integrase [Pseudonocardia halophobica]|uniref:tyrosine-type recombinase/integrase n=1 Tax=Pseudonocardia halophobica TaxID=29401 RepID=UPI003D8E4A14
MARSIAVRPPSGERTWSVIDEQYATVLPVEAWLEAHRHMWSPNTVRGYATALAQWWTFLEQRDQAGAWDEVGVPAVGAFVSWQRTGRGDGRAARSVLSGRTAPSDRAVPSDRTVAVRLAAVLSFYRWQKAVFDVAVADRLLRGSVRRASGRELLAHLDQRTRRRGESGSRPAWDGRSSLVRVRPTRSRDRPPLLLPEQVQAVLDGCAVLDPATGFWRGNLRDRLVFAMLAETGMRLGEVLGLRISDFVMGRGGTPFVEVVPRADNPNGARVKMMRPRRVYVGADLERLFVDYLAELACRADELGVVLCPDGPLLVNLTREPLLGMLGEGTVRDKVEALRRRGIGPAGWTPHWLRHTHATALLLAGSPDWVVSRRLGHAHVQTTLDLYGWVGEDAALRAAANWTRYVTGWCLDTAGVSANPAGSTFGGASGGVAGSGGREGPW